SRAVEMARQAGFDNFNLDLMHGLPDQSAEEALSDLQIAIDLAPTHLSWYQLTMEPNTVFWSKPPLLPEDDVLWDIQEAGQALLAQHGFHQYEVSAYAREKAIAQHNLNYWSFGDFIGIGAGAHGKVSDPQGRIQRTWKTRQPSDYLNSEKPFLAGNSTLAAADLPFEFLMNALRLTDGVALTLFSERTGLPVTVLQSGLNEARQRGLLSTDPKLLVASAQGQLFLNDLLQIFLTPER
ncbi:MAG: YggW family oxidoreductase, partial [Thiopseudomonas sp.]|nr:YggW family oxidoreductase [Thiopseudomonas sp.]